MKFCLPLSFTASLLLLSTFVWSSNAWGEKNEPPGDKVVGDKKKEKETPPENKKESASVCVKHTLQARFVSGFDHLVHITNECSRKASCEVSTDVNPKVQLVSILSGETKTVLTFRGSPARTFRAKVDCTLEGAPG